MSNLIFGGCIYNEADKFLTEYLEMGKKLTDKILIVDDGSTDDSLSICSKYTSNIFQTNHLYKESESKLRQYWWNKATEIANDGDYIFVCDADTILTEKSIEHYHEELYNCDKLQGDAIAGHQYDMWNKFQYREEPGLWYASIIPWITCVKYKKNFSYYWYNMKIHCGSIPFNSYFSAYPCKIQAYHWAYSTPELRAKKVEFYDEYDPNDVLRNGRKRYLSIMDKNPNLIDFKDNYE